MTHVAGATAHYLQEKNGHNVSQNLGRITGLDPARTFYPLRMVQRLRSSNGGASFIDVYHTNRGILGEVYEGTVDLNVYVNGGIIQPGCGREDLTLVPLPGICSHLFAWEVFAASFHRDFFACPCTGSDCDCSVNCRTCSPSSDNNTAVKIGLNVSKRCILNIPKENCMSMPAEIFCFQDTRDLSSKRDRSSSGKVL